MNELLCPMACMDSCCCFSAFSLNAVWNVAKRTCFSLKRAFLGLKHFSSFCSSLTVLLFQSSAFPSVPRNPSCVIFGFELLWFHSVPFCLLTGLQRHLLGVLPTQDSPCLPASDRHMKHGFAWNYIGSLLHLWSCLCFSWLCFALALLESKPVIHHSSIGSHVSKRVWNSGSKNWAMSILWEGEKVLFM